MSTTAARRRLVRRLVTANAVHSQAEIVSLLANEGHAVTQATVSRDLNVIGAVKSEGDRYVISDRPERAEALAHLARTIDEFVELISPSGNLVVVNTPPGAAQVVAAAIDSADLEHVLGTVAGDDTLFVAVAEASSGSEVAAFLEKIGAST